VVNHFFPDVSAPAGAYALVGMAAVFGAAARATFTSIIIIFELTLDYKIILPLMFACVVADLITWSLSKDTIYTKKLRRKGLSFYNEVKFDSDEDMNNKL
jgi:CIC family chloride channel protein